MNSVTTVFMVMLLSGALGGLLSYFISKDDEDKRLEWWQHIILGVGAAFVVPLLLNMISSSLIKDAIEGGQDGIKEMDNFFVLAGFCIVAAASSRSFIKSISEKILQQVRDAESKAKEAKEQASTALDLLDEQESSSENRESIVNVSTKELDENEKKVIKEMVEGRFSMRSLSGLAKNTGLPNTEVNQSITSLMSKQLIEQGKNSKNQLRWYPSASGREIANKIYDEVH